MRSSPKKEENAFDLFCEIIRERMDDRFEFHVDANPPFRYIRERTDGLRLVMALPEAELPCTMARELYGQMAFELEITDGSSLMNVGGTELPGNPYEWVRRSDDQMQGVMTIVLRDEVKEAHPILPRHLMHLLMRTRGADPASSATFMLNRAGVTLSLCDELGGERFLFSDTLVKHCSVADGLRLAETIRLLHLLSMSDPAQRLCRLYADRTYDRQPDGATLSK